MIALEIAVKLHFDIGCTSVLVLDVLYIDIKDRRRKCRSPRSKCVAKSSNNHGVTTNMPHPTKKLVNGISYFFLNNFMRTLQDPQN